MSAPTAKRISFPDCIRSRLCPLLLLVLLIAACSDHDHGHPHAAAPAVDDHAGHDHAGHDHGHAHGPPPIAMTSSVRDNLGITFATAEYRIVQRTLRFPGVFESEPASRRAYQAPLAGRIEVLVAPFQRVAIGTPLYRLAAIEWPLLQRELAEATLAATLAGERLVAAEAQMRAVEEAVGLAQQRVAMLTRLATEVGGKSAELAEASGRAAELLLQRSAANSHLVESRREAQGANGAAGGGGAAIRLQHLLQRASQLTGLSSAALSAETEGRPRWQSLTDLELVATAAGVVEGEIATSGSWLAAHATVLTITDPAGVRVRASALQGDLARLRDGLPTRIVGSAPQDPLRLEAALVLAPVADPIARTATLIARPLAGSTVPSSIRPGVAALLEVVVDGSAEEELAIPVAATIRDGLQTVFFKRNRLNPEVVEKVEADLGASDGRWVVVHSGLKEGDEVVVGGIYPLKLSQQGGGTAAGHFEADGTFHAGSH